MGDDSRAHHSLNEWSKYVQRTWTGKPTRKEASCGQAAEDQGGAWLHRRKGRPQKVESQQVRVGRRLVNKAAQPVLARRRTRRPLAAKYRGFGGAQRSKHISSNSMVASPLRNVFRFTTNLIIARVTESRDGRKTLFHADCDSTVLWRKIWRHTDWPLALTRAVNFGSGRHGWRAACSC